MIIKRISGYYWYETKFKNAVALNCIQCICKCYIGPTDKLKANPYQILYGKEHSNTYYIILAQHSVRRMTGSDKSIIEGNLIRELENDYINSGNQFLAKCNSFDITEERKQISVMGIREAKGRTLCSNTEARMLLEVLYSQATKQTMDRIWENYVQLLLNKPNRLHLIDRYNSWGVGGDWLILKEIDEFIN